MTVTRFDMENQAISRQQAEATARLAEAAERIAAMVEYWLSKSIIAKNDPDAGAWRI